MGRNHPKAVLGISLGHGDSSAALVVDGVLVAAAEEERFNRVKHFALFPENAVRYCLAHAGLDAGRVEVVAVARKPWNAWLRKTALALRYPRLWGHRNRRTDGEAPTPSFGESLSRMGLAGARLVRVEHHLAHLLSARPLCPADRAALFSFDGLGDFVSTAFGRADGDDVRVLSRIHFPHSLGFFYTAMTQYLGFPHFGDEFKMMGLSSYGKPAFLEVMRQLVRETEDGFRLDLTAFPVLERPIRFEISHGQPRILPFVDEIRLTRLLGLGPRAPEGELTDAHRDLALSVQRRFEEVASHLLRRLHHRVPEKALALAGGCAHNSVWVGKIPRETPFTQIHVAPASHDAGIAVGAAVGAFGGPVRVEGNHWALLGPAEDGLALSAEDATRVTEQRFPSEDELVAWMAGELAAGKIMGLFRGRMEFGPRALGSRSILADPRPASMRDRLNLRVKHREPFRPFAVSVLWEHQAQWFEHSFFCPAMEAVFEVKPEVREQIRAVVHGDNTCRIQSVTRETQPFYWKLIHAFQQRTGIPMLVNTSFNDSEPIVCTPRDALRCFLGSDLDYLVLGDRVLAKGARMALTG